jgi:hypothetical protein
MTMKLTTEQAITIAAGLRGLDGYDRIAKDGERERIVRELYKLGGGLRLSVAKNLNKLDALQGIYQRARADLVASMADPKGEVPQARMAEFVAEERKMLDADQDIDLAMIKEDELKLDQNPIPATTLSLIQPLLQA